MDLGVISIKGMRCKSAPHRQGGRWEEGWMWGTRSVSSVCEQRERGKWKKPGSGHQLESWEERIGTQSKKYFQKNKEAEGVTAPSKCLPLSDCLPKPGCTGGKGCVEASASCTGNLCEHSIQRKQPQYRAGSCMPLLVQKQGNPQMHHCTRICSSFQRQTTEENTKNWKSESYLQVENRKEQGSEQRRKLLFSECTIVNSFSLLWFNT